MYRVSRGGAVRYDVAYQPRRILGLHKRLLVETMEGELLEQFVPVED